MGFWLLEVMVDPKFDVEYLSAEDFYRKFKVFKENLNEKGPSLLLKAVENHPFQSTSLKWLSIGSGFGDMEDEIIEMLSKDSKLTIESLDCYEPGNEQFNHLRNHPFRISNQANVFHEAVLPSTQFRLPNRKVFQHLSPSGVVFILMLEEGQNDQIALRKATKAHLNFVKERDYQSVTLHGSQLANEEINSIAEEEFGLKVHEPEKYNITIDLDMADLSPSSTTSQLLSYIISVDFDTFPPQLKDIVDHWVREHGLLLKDESYQLTQTVTSLMYSKDI